MKPPLDPARWQRIKAIFAAAADHAPETRPAFLAAECGEDAELRAEVEALLAADDSEQSLLDRPAATHFEELSERDMIGRRIGAFQIIRRIASGGMGSVYLAGRADGQFQQQVAVKLVRRGMLSDASVKRFATERQILAALEHPHIARLVDGGVTDSGQPYFAMEYVDGVSLTEYCDTHKLSVVKRLALFEDACSAVQFAHQNLIVHRDIKPSNILVDASGKVKLVDFGIAKLLDESQLTPTTGDLTHTHTRVMTPAYASPEQRAGKPVTTATDVYSLGIVLYELLTGTRPFHLDDLSPAEIENLLATTPPPKPSSRISHPTGELAADSEVTTVCDVRGATENELRHTLSGDLDNICLMALRAEPERRYASAGQLAEDIRRYRNRWPVAARPSTAGYRVQKFVSRHRAVVAASAVFLLVMVSLSTFYVLRLARERDLARTEAAKATRVSEFLTNLFEAADPNNSQGKEVTALDLLDAGRKQITSELTEEPKVRAAMMDVLAESYHQLGHLEESRDLFEQAVATAPPGSDQYASYVHDLAVVLADLGEYDSSIVCYKRALAMDIQRYGEKDSTVASDLTDLAASVRRVGSLDSAEALIRRSLALRRELFGNDNTDVAHSLNHLGRTLYAEGRYKEAEPLLREGLDIRLRHYGDDNFEVIASRGALAALLLETGRPAEAADLYGKALASMRKLVGNDHHYVGALLGACARAEFNQGNYTKAESLYTQSRNNLEKTLPPDHERQAGPLLGLARIYLKTDRTAEAEPMLRKAVSLLTGGLDAGNYHIAEAQSLLGECLGKLGHKAEADSLLRTALATETKALGEDHQETRLTRQRLAALQ